MSGIDGRRLHRALEQQFAGPAPAMLLVRRLLTDQDGRTRRRTAWECRTKIGTNAATRALFFAEPVAGLHTECVELSAHLGPPTYREARPVLIDVVEADGLVRCTRH